MILTCIDTDVFDNYLLKDQFAGEINLADN